MPKELRSGPRHFFRLFLIKRIIFSSLQNDACVLDAGCGGGELALALAKMGLRVDGLDADEKSCNYLEKKVAAFRLRKSVRVIQQDFEHMEYPDSFFDGVICSEVLEHVEDDEGLVKKFNSFLRPGGVLVVSVPLIGKGWDRWDELAGHKRLYKRGEIISLLEKGGFRVKKALSWGFPFGKLYHKLVLFAWGNRIKNETELFKENFIITRIGKNQLVSAVFSLFLFVDLLFPSSRHDIGIIIKAVKT